MRKSRTQVDAFVATLARVQDHELADEVHAAPAVTLLATIIETPVTRERADEPPPGPQVRRTRRRGSSRARVRLLAVAATVPVAVVLTATAFGVVRDVASFFAGWQDPDAPSPTASDFVIASGKAGAPWQIVATTSEQGLCLGLATTVSREDAVLGGCAPTDVRGDPWAGNATHSIGAYGSGGGFAGLDRTFTFGPIAADVASVELVLSDGKTIRAQIVKQPRGLAVPFSFYWAAWRCGKAACAETAAPVVKLAVARDASGRVLERRVPSRNGTSNKHPSG
jgi:hypothetical protein